MQGYLLSKQDIDQMKGTHKIHFLNENAQRINKSLGDQTGLTQIGVHLVTIPPGKYSTEFHTHHHEEECVYILSGEGMARIGEQSYPIGEGDFLGYRSGGEAHTIFNSSQQALTCLVVGARLPFDVADYPDLDKRIYRQENKPWELVDKDSITYPSATHPHLGKK